MKKIILLSLLAVLTGRMLAQNIVYQDASARFTLITDGVIRMEWSADGKFTDKRSFLRTERNYAPVAAKVRKSGSTLVIQTSQMTLKYKTGTGRFTDKNLQILSAKKSPVSFAWKPGTEAKGNLKGTYRTLDGYHGGSFRGNGYDNGNPIPMPIEDGLLSTDGWTFIDDSQNLLFSDDDFAWAEERKQGEHQDFYFMAYGNNYKKALSDYTKFAGKVPLPPRYAFGYWWSRYWSYSDGEMRELVKKFRDYDIPLDVLVVDMDWHWTEEGKGGWTGYTWNRRLFPDPDRFLGWLQSEKLHITLNLHPADGVKTYEEKYPELARRLGMNPDEKKNIDFVASDKRMMDGWFDIILNPMRKAGVDFWWLDWQQHQFDPVMKTLNNTWWLNYLFFTKAEKEGTTRPLIYHRWGGLGNHRYQVGFSGDTYSTWESLDFQPYFNSTASNVLYGYWSHDLGGHQFIQGAHQLDYELMVRWHQFGAFSPIMRSHSSKSAAMRKEPWSYPADKQNAIREIIKKRYELAPYTYTMARECYDTGVSLCRPMYYDYPEAKEAYEFKNEYMYGDNLLVMPITAPANDGYATAKVWLPEGDEWYEMYTGARLKGGQTAERQFLIDEYPVYVKAGSVIPTYENVKNLRANDETVVYEIYPGARGGIRFYEDNGNDQNYATRYAVTVVENIGDADGQRVTIGKREGSYDEMPAARTVKVKAMCMTMPDRVTVDGKEVAAEFDPVDFSYTVTLENMDPNAEHVVKFYTDSSRPSVDGLMGNARRIKHVLTELKYRDAGIILCEGVGEMGSIGEALLYNPSEFNSRVEQFQKNMANLPALLDRQKLNDANKEWFLKAMNK
jgi:alpha-glucosidase (family GH31 glycosyl hydrolase)